VGKQLGITEVAAKQRVFRGLERLRGVLSKRGVAVSAEALGVTLAATAVQAAPAPLAATAAATATSATVTAQHATLVEGVTAAMTLASAKVAVMIGAVALVLAGAGVYVADRALNARDPASARGVSLGTVRPAPGSGPDAPHLMVTGPRTVPPGWDPLNGTVTPYTWDAPLVVVARTPDGAPVAGADVLVAPEGRETPLYAQSRQAFVGKTGPDGRFTFTPPSQPSGVIVRSPEVVGVARVTAPGELAVTVQPWGRIEGVMRRGNTPVGDADLFLWQPKRGGFPRWVDPNLYIRTDEQGKFTVERVLPGETMIDVRREGGREQMYRYVVGPGQTIAATMGGIGRPVVARAVPPPDRASSARGFLHPLGVTRGNPTGRVMKYPATVDPDGTVRAEDVPGGEFQLTVSYSEADGAEMEEVAGGSISVSVPPAPPGGTDEPLDVGRVEVRLRRRLKVGELVPPFAGVGFDGSPVRLEDFRGRYVLLHAWGAANAGLARQIQWLWVLYGRFGGAGEGRVQLLGVNTDATEGAQFHSADDAALARTLPWPQVVSLGKAGPLPPGIVGSTLVLVGPDGKVVARTDQLDKFMDTVRTTLTTPAGRLWNPVWAAPGVKVTIEAVPREQARANSPYKLVPAPAADDLGQGATFSIVDGRLLRQQLDRINDGRGPTNEDAPSEVVFFNWGIQPEGRIGADMGRVAPVRQIVTHSWHKDVRGPQVYNLYASDGTAPDFNPAPKAGTDPTACGWTKIAAVDTWPLKGPPGGRYAVSVESDSAGRPMGHWRYLLFATFQTENIDVDGYTFYSEIDVVEQK
jgi:hypothetical protein